MGTDVKDELYQTLDQWIKWDQAEVYGVFHWAVYWSTQGPGGQANPPCEWHMWEYSNVIKDGKPLSPTIGNGSYVQYKPGEWNRTTELHERAKGQAEECEAKPVCPKHGHCSFTDIVIQRDPNRRLKPTSGYVLQYVVAKSGCPGCKTCCGLALIDYANKEVSVRVSCSGCDEEGVPGGVKPKASPQLLFYSTWLGGYTANPVRFKLGPKLPTGRRGNNQEICV